MLRLSVSLGADEWVFGFPQDDFLVGSAQTNGLVLDHPSVADINVRLTAESSGAIMFENLDRLRPVRLNDLVVYGRTPIDEGDVLEVGPYRLSVLRRDPPERDEQAFLDAIAQNAQDDAPRAIYGDWLEENGRLEDAEFLRAQLEVRRLKPENPRFQELAGTIRTLAPRMSLAWRRAIARPDIENCGGGQYEVRCPKTWDELAPTKNADERFCGTCERPVFYVTNIERARRLALEGQCLTVDLLVKRRPRDLAATNREGGEPPPRQLDPPPPPGSFLPASSVPRAPR